MLKKKIRKEKWTELIQHIEGNKLLINRVIPNTCIAYEDENVNAMEIKEFDCMEELVNYFNSQK